MPDKMHERVATIPPVLAAKQEFGALAQLMAADQTSAIAAWSDLCSPGAAESGGKE